jgi:hypothetical protein
MKLPQCVDLEDVDNMSQFSKSSMRETNDVFVEVSRRCRAILTCDQSEFALVESVYTEMSDSPFFFIKKQCGVVVQLACHHSTPALL